VLGVVLCMLMVTANRVGKAFRKGVKPYHQSQYPCKATCQAFSFEKGQAQ
jgi:hypothetical protein